MLSRILMISACPVFSYRFFQWYYANTVKLYFATVLIRTWVSQ